ncbi:uncharacterized protein LOC144239447 [Crocuta crocuta]
MLGLQRAVLNKVIQPQPPEGRKRQQGRFRRGFPRKGVSRLEAGEKPFGGRGRRSLPCLGLLHAHGELGILPQTPGAEPWLISSNALSDLQVDSGGFRRSTEFGEPFPQFHPTVATSVMENTERRKSGQQSDPHSARQTLLSKSAQPSVGSMGLAGRGRLRSPFPGCALAWGPCEHPEGSRKTRWERKRKVISCHVRRWDFVPTRMTVSAAAAGQSWKPAA